ncbi:glycoside hydrolase family 92 protein [Pedobacter frigiditerrae]|uniref:Glycoside hydrolase family 92 protein n=1 Tax=Pedobacter frigiditerrae TaxID=2530452 RepID=A0A4R0MSW7_9SPHI|nr:GH92 family glycosyl hydrolase [Pedobacter frigiditerrae]TCC90119.1 glycoside hydrolase family 92 protein [Pedobacter frigiditerrae]
MKLKLTLLFTFCLLSQLMAQEKDLVNYVNTLQGTNSKHELTRGNTYPTTALPFGMHTWTPQTGRNGDGWKYQYFKDKIRGFQQAHQCSSWTRDYAVFSLMPMSDKLVVNENDREAKFSHTNEIAKPNYYKVTFDNQITTEISPTERGAHIRFSYPAGKKSFLVLDGYTRLSGVQIFPKENKIMGWVNNGEGFKRGWKSYFVIKFDQAIKGYGTWENKTNKINADSIATEGFGKGAYIEFKAGVKVQAKIASSYISLEQAELNLKSELGLDKNLEQTKAKAAEVWNKSLGKVLVEGGTEADIETFYSCFFRASLFSRKFYEIDKNGKPYYFSPYDGKIHEGYMFTDTGFWDTFRAQFPLNTLLHPEMQGRYMQAMLDAYKQCGWLPSWSFPSEAGSMIGNHAISLLADAWVKGIRTFDPKEALDAYYHEATNKGPWGPANGRDGWKEYFQLGYVPYPKYREATAKTLEYAYDDYCGYQLASLTDNTFYKDIFGRQMYNYRNVYDPSTKFMRGKDAEGKWSSNFDPIEWGGPFTEGNAWHWVWSVFHDTKGLIDLVGGNNKFTSKLDSVFSEPNKVKVGTYGGMIHEMTEMVIADMGQYAHGNQPIQHMVYLYNYANQPWKSQFYAREVMRKLYNATENGYPGDEDQGQTSSWYVLSALGFYSVTPGTGEYVLGSPLFKKITLTLENGKKFIVDAPANDKNNVYIKSATLNGKSYSLNFLTHKDITNGGVLKLEMDDKPNFNRGLNKEDKPFSLTK